LNKIILTLILLLMASPVWAVTTLTKTVCIPSGCDYTSLESALNGNEKNLVTSDQTFNVVISGTWATPDTTAVIAHNYTTDATHGVNIYTTGDARHDGRAASVSGRQNYILNPTLTSDGSYALNTSSNTVYITVDGIELIPYQSGTQYMSVIGIYVLSPNAIIKNNIIHDMALNTLNGYNAGILIFRRGQVFNNIIYNVAGWGIYDNDSYGGTIHNIYNNTVYKFATNGHAVPRGINVTNNAGYYAKNNLVISTTSNPCYSIAGGTTTTNGSSDATGTAGLQNLTAANLFVSVTAGSEDLRLKAGAAGIDVGTDLGASYNTDIIGTSRPQGSAWDIGAFEYIASTPTSFGSVLNDSVWNDTVFK
jgi:hypothetical protein